MNQCRQLLLVLFSALCMLVSPPASHADTGDAFVKGATDFLLDRANDNYIYIFQRKLEANPLLNKYLPATLRVAKAGDLRSLITHKELWKKALKEDLQETKLFKIVDDNLLPLVKQLCDTAASIQKPLDAELSKLCEKADKLSAKSAGATTTAVVERTATQLTTAGHAELIKKALSELLGTIENANLSDSCKEVKNGKGYTECAIAVLSALEALAHADYVVHCYVFGNWCSNKERKLSIRAEDDDFDDFRRYVLFFAQLADVADTDDSRKVSALLKSVTIPSVSFGIKREPHRTRVLVTAYAGGGWAAHRETGRKFAVAAPIGVEISQARDSGNSLSLLLSPIDLGYPLSLKLNGDNTDVKASDVFIPGVYVLRGWKNYPLAAGAGYSRVKRIDDPTRREGRLMFLLAFDMPLFKLY